MAITNGYCTLQDVKDVENNLQKQVTIELNLNYNNDRVR